MDSNYSTGLKIFNTSEMMYRNGKKIFCSFFNHKLVLKQLISLIIIRENINPCLKIQLAKIKL